MHAESFDMKLMSVAALIGGRPFVVYIYIYLHVFARCFSSFYGKHARRYLDVLFSTSIST